MEFVKAEVLSDRLAALEGPMEIDEFSRHALAILGVIEIAHGRGLVHCDLKPENVFIDETLGAKLFDFGLVRKLGARRASRRPRKRHRRGRPSTCRPSSARRAPTSTRAATSTRWA